MIPIMDIPRSTLILCHIFLEILLITKNGKVNPAQQPDRNSTSATFQGQKFQVTPWNKQEAANFTIFCFCVSVMGMI